MTKAGLDQVAVFWDFENCRLPCNVPGNRVIERIRRLVQHYGSIVAFKAYMDLALESSNPRASILHSDLQSSGVSLVHCPHNGKKDVADKMMIVDMLVFAIENPPPAAIVIITGDRDFAYATAVLRLRGYHTIVISPPTNAHASIKLQASLLYDWQKDVLDGSSPETSQSPSKLVGLTPSVPQSLSSTASAMDISATSSLEDLQATTPRACTYIEREFLPTPPDNSTSRTISDYRHKKSASVPCSTDSFEPDNVIGTNVKLPSASRTESHGKVTWPNTSSTSLTLNSDNSFYQGRDMRSIGVSTEPYCPTSLVLGSFGTSTVSIDFETASSFSETDDDGLALNTAASPSRQSDNSLPSATSSTSVESNLNSSNLQLKSSLDDGGGCVYTPSRPGNDETQLVDVLGETANALNIFSAPIGRRHPCPPSCPAEALSQTGTEVGPTHQPTPERNGISIVVASSTNTHPPTQGLSSPFLVQKDSPTRAAPTETISKPSLQDSPAGTSEPAPDPPNPTEASRQRFQSLILFFTERRAAKCSTRIHSSQAAAELLKRDSQVYQKAGVDKLKTFIEEARNAGVIVGPGMDKQGNAWLEINPVLYPSTAENPQTTINVSSSASPSKEPISPSTPPSAHPTTSIEAIYIPLVYQLRMEAPSYRMLYSKLGMFVRTKCPNLYGQAHVSGLTSYLQKAESQGIVLLGRCGTPGSEWVQLMPAYRKPNS